jgi:uncharacterized protein
MNGLRVIGLMVLVVVFGGCVGCNKPVAAPVAAANTSNATMPITSTPDYPTKAQPKLQTLKLWLGAEELVTELALGGIQQQTGMMFRTNMPENEAMLFVFPYPHQASFWMKNTYVPLSAAYINPEGVILEIHKLEPLNTNSVEATCTQIQYVLETPQGWFERHNVGTGTVVRTEYGPLKSTFTQKRSP